MQDLESNMDRMFHRAAENYLVNFGESDWDTILAQLDDPPLPSSTKKNSKKNIALSLLLLLCIFMTATFIRYFVIKSAPVVVHKLSRKNENNNSVKVTNDADVQANIDLGKQGKKQPASLSFSTKDDLRINLSSLLANKSTFQNAEITKIENKNLQDMSLTISANVDKKIPALFGQTLEGENKKITARQSAQDANKAHQTLKQHRFYSGFIAGASFSEVKNQGMQKPGFDIGVMGGYKLIEKVSVETGLSLSKKNYFTDGKYFNMDKIASSMPPEMKVMSIEGHSTVLEIPFKFKYNMLNKNKTAFYSSVGLSSYVLTNEKNNYHTLMNGTNENITSTYKNSSRYLAASIDLSIGCEHRIGDRNNKISVESYVQIPLKGIGVGALPVTGVGLHVGYTFFHR